MWPWFMRRLLSSVVLVLVLLTVVFFVVRLAPGDPLDQVVAEQFDAADRQQVRQQLGLTKSLPVQYLNWVAGIVRGDLGTSLRQHRPVSAIIGEALPATLLLTVSAYLLHFLLAVLAATLMARYRGKPADRLIDIVGLLFYSVPGFWLGLMMILLFCLKLGWLPSGGMYSPDANFMSGIARFFDLLKHLILPVTTLALGSFMGTARHLRSSLIGVQSQDYILAARSRGLTERAIFFKHTLRNALMPMITLFGLYLPFLLGGAVVTEVIFAWPGMGRVTIEAIWARDYPVIMATSTLSGVMVVFGSLFADLLYSWADPRVRLSRRKVSS